MSENKSVGNQNRGICRSNNKGLDQFYKKDIIEVVFFFVLKSVIYEGGKALLIFDYSGLENILLLNYPLQQSIVFCVFRVFIFPRNYGEIRSGNQIFFFLDLELLRELC